MKIKQNNDRRSQRTPTSTMLALCFACCLTEGGLLRAAPPIEVVAVQAEALIKASARTGDTNGLAKAEKVLQAALTEHNSDPILLHYLGYEVYCETGPLDPREALTRLKQGNDYLKQSQASGDFPETPALRAVILGRLTKADPRKAMTFGLESKRQIDLALRLGPENPRVWLLRGILAWYEPAAVGGGWKRAEEYLRKAIILFSHQTAKPPFPTWGREEAYCWLGQVLIQKGDLGEAEIAYKDALSIAPDFAWVRDDLMPALKRRQLGAKR